MAAKAKVVEVGPRGSAPVAVVELDPTQIVAQAEAVAAEVEARKREVLGRLAQATGVALADLELLFGLPPVV